MVELSLLIVPALAAALVGRFSSFTATLAGAFAIGIAESELTRYVTFPGASKAVPLLLILAMLALSGHARSEEHTSELQSLMRISYAVFCLKKKKKTKRTR